MNIDVMFEQRDMDLQVSFDDKLQLISSGILNDADALAQGTISGAYVSDKVTSLRPYAFSNCRNLTSISLPNCTTFAFSEADAGSYFRYSTNLKTINLPKLTTIENGGRTFNGCQSLEEVNLPNLTSVTTTSTMFSTCYNIRKINLPKLGGVTINASTFPNCYRLETLILGGNELNPLDNVNAFKNTGTATENGLRICVPDDLVDTYKTATNWSAFADQIKPISELED